MAKKENLEEKKLYPPKGQRAVLAAEFGITVKTLSKYMRREYPWYSQAYPKQQEICRRVFKRLGSLCLRPVGKE